MRPFKRGEAVPAPTFPSDDMPIDDKPWLSGAWVLEYVGDDLEQRNGIFRGLLVRQSWLSRPGGGADRSGTWDGLVKVERLLVCIPSHLWVTS